MINSNTGGRFKKRFFLAGGGAVVLAIIIFGVWQFLLPPIGRTSFLVLGIAGGNHQGPDLADSIIFVSVENQTGKTLVFSLPRDIWIAPWRTKLNSIYHYKGMEETKKTISEILGQKIDYGVVVDFKIFTQMVDSLGGVEVEVERSFADEKYPIAGKENDLCGGDPEFKCRYETVRFEAGKQRMNGETALRYVRSRNAEGEEGTDFARSQRQQRLLLAIKKKVFSPQIIFNPKRAVQLIKLASLNIKTDIPKEKYDDFLKIALRFRTKNLKMDVLNEGYLITPPPSRSKYDNQWVLIPKSGGWEEVHDYVEQLISGN